MSGRKLDYIDVKVNARENSLESTSSQQNTQRSPRSPVKASTIGQGLALQKVTEDAAKQTMKIQKL